jgi:hypothetical protein
MMERHADLTGTVRIAGEPEAGVHVEIHLEHEELRLVSGYGELGRWPLSELGIAAKLDGFHLRIEGEELIVSTNDDARFALALGIRSSNSPRLNRLLANARDAGLDVAGVLTPTTPTVLLPELEWKEEEPISATPVAVGVLLAAVLQLLGGFVPFATDSGLTIFSSLSPWPFWLVAGLATAFGGFALFNGFRRGRQLAAAGVVIGLLVATGSVLGAGRPGFSWVRDGVVLRGAGSILAGLLLSIDRLPGRDYRVTAW